ncbi:glycosyltransferase family protein [Nostoc parmelioides]|uniref:Glycosyltransferase n=1 Tax=Nostoc parmelioides FACHB-3921 TaxID=2692909 RepID=A0ABR8B8C0_9NOSO|nr:glycosyltransferase family protein [Nostoc parmelioides]MBD2250096.1 glycosyltransferase [Nostoc parmelioides FACHB-3921]
MNKLLPHSRKITRTSARITSHEARKCRIALYSHDTMGLGHKRRNLLIAQTLGFSPLQTDILMISGIQDASNLPTPPGVDCLTLPALHKNIDGQYQARKLDLSLQEIIALRSQVILATIKTFKPDIFIVDNVPRGAVRELDPTLEYLRREGKTHCILGLRDILDEPASVRRDWKRAANEEAIQTYYDQVWVYGDRNIYDLAKEYHLQPKTAAKFRYTGYLDQRNRLKYLNLDIVQSFKSLNLPSERLVLCLVGGGQDGAQLAETFAHAELPSGMNGIILTGPFMPREFRQKLHNYAAQRDNLRVLEYLAEPTMLLHQAERVIAMGGYNTTCELLSFGKRSLILPRVKPRKEQLIRAERLKELGLIDFLHPDKLTSAALTDWLKLDIEPPPVRKYVDLKGLTRIPQFVHEILMSAHQEPPHAKAS